MIYGIYSIAINNGIRDGDSGKLHYAKYREMGLNDRQARARMDKKDAGHILARNNGGRNTAGNYIWEDSHDNRAHRIKIQELKKACRWNKVYKTILEILDIYAKKH